MNDIEIIGEDGGADYWREQIEIDRWMDAGCPPVDDWLAGRKSPARPRRKTANALPPSELVHMQMWTTTQAGTMLGGMSEDWIEQHVLPYVKTIVAGRTTLIDADDLVRWRKEKAARGALR